MNCEICQQEIEQDECRKWKSQRLCEDCYIDVLAPSPGKNHWQVLNNEHGKPDY